MPAEEAGIKHTNNFLRPQFFVHMHKI